MKRILFSLLIHFYLSSGAQSQITVNGTTPIVETFDALNGTNLPTGWKMSAAGAGATAGWNDAGNSGSVTVSHTTNGIPSAGRIHWRGENGSGSTPSIGFYSSASYAAPNAIFAQYRNQTGSLINSVRVNYTVQRRITRIDSQTSGAPTFQLSYSTDGTTWTALSNADFGAFNSFYNSATPGSGIALGSAGKTVTITELSIPINGHLYLRWNVLTLHSGVHWGLGLDNVTFQVTGTAPAQMHWIGDDTTRGGAGTWAGNGGTSWSNSDIDGNPGVSWDPSRTAQFGGSEPSMVTISGNVSANLGAVFLASGSSLTGGNLVLGGPNRAANTFTVADGVFLTLDTTVEGINGFAKDGEGTLLVSRGLHYSGGTDILKGSVILAGSGAFTSGAGSLGGGNVSISSGASLLLGNNLAIPNSAALILANGASIDLGFTPGTMEVVASLTINGTRQPDGTHGASRSGAQYINDSNFTGTGLLYAGTPPGDPNSLFWVGDDPVLGGQGSWQSSGGNSWALVDADIPGTPWDENKTAVFGGIDSPVATLDESIPVARGIRFRTSGTTLTGGTLLLTANLTASNRLEVEEGSAATIQSNIAGSSGFTKSGEGTLILSGAMSYTGGCVISNGTLAVSSTGSLGEGTITIVPTSSADSILLLENPNAIPDSATLALTSSGAYAGRVHLSYPSSEVEALQSLVLDGVDQPAGSYGATGSGAQYVSDVFFSGSGMLLVGSSSRIEATGNLTALATTYGTSSTTGSFSFAASGLKAAAIITPPPAFEVSTDASFASNIGSNASPLVVGSAGDIPSTSVYVRLSSTASAGTYTGIIQLSSPQSAGAAVPTAPSQVLPKPLGITAPSITSRVYDGSNAPASTSAGTLSGLVGSQQLGVTAVASAYPATAVGTYPSVSVSYILRDGANGGVASNYSLASSTAPASVTQRPVQISGLSPVDKVYDGTTSVTINGSATLASAISGDDIRLEGTATFAFAQANAGSNVPINTTGLSLAGSSSSNYELSPTTLAANILKAPQTITFPEIPAKFSTDEAFVLSASASSGLEPSYSSSNPAVATVDGSTVTILSAGNTILTANQSGDQNYEAALPVSRTLTINASFKGRFDFEPHDGTSPDFAYNGSAIPKVTVGNLRIVGMNATSNDPNLSASWPCTGPLNANGVASASLTGTPNPAAYFEFTLLAESGYALSNARLRFGFGRETNGPRQFQWRASADGFTNPLSVAQAANDSGSNALPPHEIFGNEFRVSDDLFFDGDPISDSVFSEVVSTSPNRSSMTFRFYAYGAEAASAAARLTRFLDFVVDVTPSANTVPGAPNLEVTSNSNQLRLAYTAPEGSVTGYEYSLDAGQNWTVTETATPTSPITINNLVNGQSYGVQIRALNAVGVGDASPVINAVPQPNTINGLAANDTRTINAGSYTLAVTSSSGLPVLLLSSNSAVATANGTTLSIVGSGQTTITARQPGSGDVAAAPDATQTLTVLPSTWTLLENFESLNTGDLNGQEGWSVSVGTAGGNGTAIVAEDSSNPSNSIAKLLGTHAAAHRFVANLSDHETFTLFHRFRFDNLDSSDSNSGESNVNIGLSRLTSPSAPSDFAAHFFVNPASTTPFMVRHSDFAIPNNLSVGSDTWYSAWHVLDNSNGTYKLFIQGGNQSTPVAAATSAIPDGLFSFRTPGTIQSARIYLRTLANHLAATEVDDFHFAAGTSLSTPAHAIQTFADWASERGLSGNPSSDFDGDSLSDAVELVLGTDPTVRNSTPFASQVNPDRSLTLTFTRSDESEVLGVSIEVEGSTTLSSWPLAYAVGTDSASSSSGVTISENGSGPDTVTVTIPAQGSNKLFARILVTTSNP